MQLKWVTMIFVAMSNKYMYVALWRPVNVIITLQPCHNFMELYDSLFQAWFTVIKTEFNIQPMKDQCFSSYRNQSINFQIKSIDWFQYDEKHWSLMGWQTLYTTLSNEFPRKLGNFRRIFKLRGYLIPSVSSKNKTLAIVVSNYSKTEIKVLCSSPILLDFSSLFKMFFLLS